MPCRRFAPSPPVHPWRLRGPKWSQTVLQDHRSQRGRDNRGPREGRVFTPFLYLFPSYLKVVRTSQVVPTAKFRSRAVHLAGAWTPPAPGRSHHG